MIDSSFWKLIASKWSHVAPSSYDLEKEFSGFWGNTSDLGYLDNLLDTSFEGFDTLNNMEL